MNRVQGFLGPGHVCAIMGYREYEPIAARYKVPIVITGFEPLDLLEGTLMTVRQLEQGRAEVENQYARAVTREGNVEAQKMIYRVFKVSRPELARHRDHSEERLPAELRIPRSRCRANLRGREHPHQRARRSASAARCCEGLKKPMDCPAFGTQCTPQTPLGATMVSAEGACAAYYNYGRHLVAT